MSAGNQQALVVGFNLLVRQMREDFCLHTRLRIEQGIIFLTGNPLAGSEDLHRLGGGIGMELGGEQVAPGFQMLVCNKGQPTRWLDRTQANPHPIQ